jgi:hypothetical protein
VPYYTVIDLQSMEPREPRGNGGARAEVLMLRGEDGDVFPVFTSLARFWAFVDEYFVGDDLVEPSTFPMDPFRLAEMIEQSGGTGGFCFLVFDPIAVSAGQWSSMKKPIPVAHYCRFISEIRPGIQQLTRECIARFGTPPPGSAAYEEAMEWYRPQIEGLADSVGARVNEWWDKHGA